MKKKIVPVLLCITLLCVLLGTSVHDTSLFSAIKRTVDIIIRDEMMKSFSPILILGDGVVVSKFGDSNFIENNRVVNQYGIENRMNCGSKTDGDPEERSRKEETPTEETSTEETTMVSNDDNVFGQDDDFQTPEKVVTINPKKLTIDDIYTIDEATWADKQLLDVQKFAETESLIDPGIPGPQILILHTHSKEEYVATGKEKVTVVEAGDYLSELLTNEYGFEVLHCRDSFDDETRDHAYSRAAESIDTILKDNPGIQVILDLHRDEIPEGITNTAWIDGKNTAKIMFFNGISRLKDRGEIGYLKNDNLEKNLAFSFQMQVRAMEYFPGVTRKIYLRGYRYNMHMMDKYLLVELGAQNNTDTEAYNACEVLAKLLWLVLRKGWSITGQ